MKTTFAIVRTLITSVFSIIILGGFSIPAYAAVPSVSSFTASLASPQVVLSWVTPSGTFTEFDIRQSSQPINEDNFNAASQISGVPSPIPGETQTMNITGLTSGTTYYFGVHLISFTGDNSPLAIASVITPGAPGGGLCSQPSQAGNFTVSFTGTNATLSWLTPAGNPLAESDIRQSSQPINEDNFNAASQIAGVPSPIPGETQTMNITGLTSGTTYYFGIRLRSVCGDFSSLATIFGTTLPVPPVSGGGSVSFGSSGTSFTGLPINLVRVAINDGATSTTDRTVMLTIYADNATEMAIVDTASSSIAMWRPYATTSPWIFFPGNGPKFVYVKFRNSVGEFKETASSSILFTGERVAETIVIPIEPVVLAPIVAKIPVSPVSTSTNGEISFSLLPSTVKATEGDRITIVIAAKPVGSGNGALTLGGFKLAYPHNLITLESVTYGQGWTPSLDPNANVTDSENGLLIQATQYPQNLKSSQVFAVLSFSMKQAGSDSVELTNNLVGAPTSTTALSIIALEKDLRPKLFASLIFSLGGKNQNLIAFWVVFVVFAILYIISFPFVKFAHRKILKWKLSIKNKNKGTKFIS